MNEQNSHRYAVIMAGGSGSRMWPISRKHTPKQFETRLSNPTMFQRMYGILREEFPPERILVQTNRQFEDMVRVQVPELPEGNIILEPEARDTAPAFGLAAAVVEHRDPEALAGIFYSDHLIGKESRQKFLEAIETSFEAAEELRDHIVIIGVTPRYPHTGLGYLELKEKLDTKGGGEVFLINRFIEKPDHATSEALIASGTSLWNTGNRVFSVRTFLSALQGIDASFVEKLRTIVSLLGREGESETIAKLYGSLPKVSAEYFITEHLKNLAAVPADIEWSDMGDWVALHKIIAENPTHPMKAGDYHVSVECEDCLVWSSGRRLIATLGLKDVVVIDTGDVILVTTKERSQDMKKVAALLEERGKHEFL